MYLINAKKYEKEVSVMPLGHQLEDDTREVYYDISEWIEDYGPGRIEWVYKRPNEEMPYLVAQSRQEDGVAIWRLSETDTSVAGEGRCELRFYPTSSHPSTPDLIKTMVFRTHVFPSLIAEGEPPQPEVDWLEIVRQAAAGVARQEAEAATNDLKERFDNVISAVTTDTEVIDIRVGANGITYPTAGEAVRGQLDETVKIVPQDLTDAQKAQARANINASAPDGYYGASGGVYQYSTNFLGKNTPQNASDINFRPTASQFSGSGWNSDSISGQTATIEKIKGKTLVFNQIAHADRTSTATYAGVVMSDNKDEQTLTLNGTATGSVRRYNAFKISSTDEKFGLRPSHKIIMSCKWISGSCTTGPNEALSDGYVGSANIKWADVVANKVVHMYYTTASSGQVSSVISAEEGDVFNNLVVKINYIDLTQMFGAGNEPATVKEFKAMFPLDYYAYNTGELISLNATGLKTTGFNQLDEDGHIQVLAGLTYKIEGTYTSLKDSAGNDVTVTNREFTPTANDTYTMVGGSCVHLKWSGVRDGDTEDYWDSELFLPIATYFADGMKSAGTVYDELTKDKAIKRIGKLDLGTLTWETNEQETSIFFTNIPTDRRPVVNTLNMFSSMFTPVSRVGYNSIPDKRIETNFDNNSKFYIHDSAYTDATAFKTAMSGVYLYYELAEPVETPINPPLNLTYRCDDFGTEMLLPQNDDEPVTAPMDADIVYQINYEANVRNSDSLNITKESFDNFISAFNGSGLGTITQTWDATNKKYTYTVVPPAEPEEE